MPIDPIKVWSQNEVLTAVAQNAEFANIRAQAARWNEDEDIAGNWTFSGDVDFSGAVEGLPRAVEVFNVKDYGALGNGVADDQPSIQAAVDDIPSTGGILHIPRGTYLSGLAVTLKRNVIVIGEGPNISKVQFTNATKGFVAEFADLNERSNTYLKDLQVVSHPTLGTALELISFKNAINYGCSNVVWSGSTTYGLKVDSSYFGTFQNCASRGRSSALGQIYLTGLSNNWAFRELDLFADDGEPGILVEDSGWGVLDTCGIQSGTGSRGTTGVIVDGANYIRVVTCFFEHWAGPSISDKAGGSVCKGILIQHNHLHREEAGTDDVVDFALSGTAHEGLELAYNRIPMSSSAGTRYVFDPGSAESFTYEVNPTDGIEDIRGYPGSNFRLRSGGQDRGLGAFGLADGITAPSTVSGTAQIYVDTSDGDLKVKFGDGTVKTLATDT